MAEQLNIIIVPHTHWDREWYQTFQQFRMRLVHTVDTLLDILQRDPGFTHFMLDGQTIVLDDYLEVRPEQEELLKQLTRAGRIQVGPWYLQPDEFLVSGESLVRNLQIGLQRAAEFGEPMRVGYVPDCFGHIAQLPQILQGFGIDNAVFWRGVGSEAHTSEFYWTAPDGTSVLVIHLADARGYSNAAVMPLTTEEFVTRVELLTAPLLAKATSNTLLFMNGSDHLQPQDGLPEVIESANKLLTHIDPEREKILTRYGRNAQHGDSWQLGSIHLQIGTLPQYIQAVRQHIERSAKNAESKPLQTLSGEMRSSELAHLLPSVLSTRMWIKQQNAETEHLLERWVEPLTAWAWKLGAPYPQGLIRLAWKYLLQNHPHDSICGCSIDQVHNENKVRFAQSQQIGEGLVAYAAQQCAELLRGGAPGIHFYALNRWPATRAILGALRAAKPDLVMLGTDLPPGEALALLREVRHLAPDVPVQYYGTGFTPADRLAAIQYPHGNQVQHVEQRRHAGQTDPEGLAGFHPQQGAHRRAEAARQRARQAHEGTCPRRHPEGGPAHVGAKAGQKHRHVRRQAASPDVNEMAHLVNQDQDRKANAELHAIQSPVERHECPEAQQEFQLEERQQEFAVDE